MSDEMPVPNEENPIEDESASATDSEDESPEEDFRSYVQSVCKNFTETLNELNIKRNESLMKNKDARLLLDQAVAITASAKTNMESKEFSLKSAKERLELLQVELAVAEEELKLSREHFDRCLVDEEDANKKYRYSLKDLGKYEMADRVSVKYLTEFFVQRKKIFANHVKQGGM